MPTSKPEKKEPKKPLSVTHPDLAKEAYGWDPSTFKPMSGKNLTWKCTMGHIFNSIIANRSKGVGCGVCAVPNMPL